MHDWQTLLENFTLQTLTEPEDYFCDLSSFSTIKLVGPPDKAKALLQGQFTCDLNTVNETQTRVGAHCNPKGRIINLSLVFFFKDHYYLFLPKSLAPLALQALNKYAVFFKVHLVDTSNELFHFGYCGNHLEKYIQELPQNDYELKTSQQLNVIKIPGHTPRYQIFGELLETSQCLRHIAKDYACCPFDYWKLISIDSGYGNIYAETTEKFLPHELNLPNLDAISFTKGCFTGQEIIARMQYKAKLKKSLVSAIINTETTPQLGADIYDRSGTAGSIVDFVKKSYNTYHLLLTLNDMQEHETYFIDDKHTNEFLIGKIFT